MLSEGEPIIYLDDWDFGVDIGMIPVYTDEYMPRDRLYIIGVPEEEPSAFLIDFRTGKPLPVPNSRKLRKIALINPNPKDSVTVIDYTAR